MTDVNNLNPNLDPDTLPLNSSTLIEASAGTGKTFTIAILYVRLVLGDGQPEGSDVSGGHVAAKSVGGHLYRRRYKRTARSYSHAPHSGRPGVFRGCR